jgi:hypothetical protein
MLSRGVDVDYCHRQILRLYQGAMKILRLYQGAMKILRLYQGAMKIRY